MKFWKIVSVILLMISAAFIWNSICLIYLFTMDRTMVIYVLSAVADLVVSAALIFIIRAFYRNGLLKKA